MTPQDFNQWQAEYGRLFPSVARWLVDLGDACPPMLELWRKILADVELDEALSVSRAMAEDRLEAVGWFDSDRERTAVFIRRAVMARRRDQEPKVSPEMAVPRKGRYRSPAAFQSIREQAREAERLVKAGRTWKEAAAIVVGVDDQDGKRAFCVACRDMGLVHVWSREAVAQALHDVEGIRSDPALRRPRTVPCACESGEPYVWDREEPPPRMYKGWTDRRVCYSVDRYCIFLDPEDKNQEDQIERLVRWATARRSSNHSQPQEENSCDTELF